MYKGYRHLLLTVEPTYGPHRLFANGEQGAWYDPSDFSTMFQDSAGTTPVTAIEQPVGRILDKSGRGNTATQSTTTSRPILRNLYNILTYTEQFDNAAWTKTNTTVTQNATTAPDGTLTADTLTPTTTGFQASQVYLVSGTYTASVSVKDNGAGSCAVGMGSGAVGYLINVNLTTGAYISGRSYGGGSLVSYSISSQGNGWWRVSVIATATNGGVIILKADGTNPTSGIYVWGASLVPANEASIPYQRVVTNTLGSGVYDTDLTKFPAYLRSDRTDDSYTTTDGGGSTTGFFFCASILLQTAGQTHTLISDTGTNTGYRVRINSSNQLELSAGNGSAYTTATTTDTLATGQMAVITAWHDGTKLYAQINNGAIAEQAFGTATAGTAGMTIGKDNGAASNYLGGGIYAHVYRKDKAPTDVERTKTKVYCAAKGGITL